MKISEIEVGSEIGNWLVIGDRQKHRNGNVQFLCRCKCGKESLVFGTALISNNSTQCNECRVRTSPGRQHPVGKRYKNWTLVERIPSDDGVQLLLRCDCGYERVGDSRSLNAAGYRVCLGCQAVKKTDQVKTRYWKTISANADIRGLEFTLSQNEIFELLDKQQYKCALSGVPIRLAPSSSRMPETTASLDRIDSDLGYVQGNIQWVHKEVNYLKNDRSDADLIYWCCLIADYQRRKLPPDDGDREYE